MDTPPSDLTGYASHMLVGTDLNPETASLTAAGKHAAASPVAAALRDGWVAAEHLPTLPAPVTADTDGQDR